MRLKLSTFDLRLLTRASRGGFTIVELTVSLAIFLILSSVVLAKYRTFDTNAKFANAVEDVVLALRQAQVYGVGSKGNTVSCGASSFECSYGVHLFPHTSSEKNRIISFVDNNENHVYDTGEELPGGTIIWPSNINVSFLNCPGCMVLIATPPFAEYLPVSITFKRPSPDAFIAKEANVASLSDVYVTLTDSNTLKSSTVRINKSGLIATD